MAPARPTTTVSVVIPTVLRPSAARAVGSVRAQTHRGAVEVVVVVDRDRADCSAADLAHVCGADQVLFTGGGGRAGRARNTGVAAAGGDLVAFLDDDDEWLPDKLAHQVPALVGAEHRGRQVVVGSRVVQRHAVTGTVSTPVPQVAVSAGDRIEDYLFRRRRPSAGRAAFFTSTFLARRELARAVPWDPALPRHQDWDWLLRAQRDGGAHFVQVPQVTVVYTVGSAGSISAAADWRASLAWARSWRAQWDRHTYADFVTGQPLRYAVQARSVPGARECLREVAATGIHPSSGPVLMAAGSVVPRQVIEKLLTRPGRSVPA